jgi:CheY-like chemotaxis protein
VLVVEDEPSIRGVVEQVLLDEGYAVVPAESLPEAIERLEDRPVDLILTDCVWSQPGRVDLAPLAQLAAAAPGVPIVLSSTRILPGTLEPGGHGLFAVVSKPFEIDQLLDVARRATRPPLRLARRPDPGRGAILLIEDNPEIGRLIQEVLEDEGWPVARYERGLAALLAVRQLQPRLILLDLNLGDVDGRTLLRALADDPVARGTPVLVVSANAKTLSKIDRALVAAVVTKPFEVDKLVAAVERLAVGSGR